MSSRNPQKQMPPIGTQLIDAGALALIERWIAQEIESYPHQEESQP